MVSEPVGLSVERGGDPPLVESEVLQMDTGRVPPWLEWLGPWAAQTQAFMQGWERRMHETWGKVQDLETQIAVETGRMVFDARVEQKAVYSVQLRNLIENQIGEKFSQVKSTLETWFVSEISSRLANLDLDGTKSTLQEWFVGAIISRLN